MPQSPARTQSTRRLFNIARIPCAHPGCQRLFKNKGALTQHKRAAHQHSFRMPQGRPTAVEEVPDRDAPPSDVGNNRTQNHFIRDYHIELDGRICDEDGNFIDPGAPPPPFTTRRHDDWTPYRSRLEFETAEFLFTKTQMSAGHIDELLHLWGVSLAVHGDDPPFADHVDLHNTIDQTPVGDVPWNRFTINYTGDRDGTDAPWMDGDYEIFYRDPHNVVRNMISTPDFKDTIDYAPYREWEKRPDGTHKRRWRDFMSGDWAWDQADQIAEDPLTHGAAFVPVILGSDKTTVSVATGQNDYHPLYLSIGNVHNSTRRAHRNAVAVVGFLAIPKTAKEYSSDSRYRKFKKQLLHTSLSRILNTLKPAMTTPEVTRCADGHYRRVIYGLGPYIADYEEQVVLAGIVREWCAKCIAHPSDLEHGGELRTRELVDALVEEVDFGTLWDEWGIIGEIVPFTNDFPRADIHELLAPDLLHQVIKGTFKDHLVSWVEQYLEQTHGGRLAKRILDDIDRRIAAAPYFTGLRRFYQGRGFLQWTGDDSKALMKVYLPAIEGYVPPDMVRALRAFLEFCYIARHDIITDDTLKDLENALQRFHKYREIFITSGVRSDFSLPRQHALHHYCMLIRMFGAPNGLCSSITESKHIKAVKEPWRRSNRYNALGQMLLTNQRLDKIAASRADFTARGMLDGPCAISYAKYFERKRARTVSALATELNVPNFPLLLRLFLYDQLYADDTHSAADVPLRNCPSYTGRIDVFNSAVSTFFAPSDASGISGMRREHIRAAPRWRQDSGRYDCVFVNTDNTTDGINEMDIARVLCFFSFPYKKTTYPCALVHWFKVIGTRPDQDTGMWMVRPSFDEEGAREISIIHIDSIFRAAHLLPIFGDQSVPKDITYHNSLDAYRGFYVNKFADHHAFEIAS
ncbi:hypothetical protein BV22DRAFT_1108435 [Leucogyrophana mollusca]|uniref:Uncharacterized protein n=1 Tax=Leucogyrophana mollusca TaxID=85980 RepID=A0ACB8AY42_9AGAM|nr:hypothetical protein BV22DRAFT_1108435 [Leucogyrophana mollusca]